MPLLVTSLPNLVQGISQQPDNLRYPGQSDEQINAWSTVVEGLVKRPHTEYVKNVDATAPGANLFTHFVKREETNKYVLKMSMNGATPVLSATNTETGDDLPVTPSTIATNYLSNITNPREDVKALTVADYTFLVNKKRVVAVNDSEDTLTSVPDKEALIAVKLGDYAKTYTVDIDTLLPVYDSSVSWHNVHHDPTHNTTDVVDATYKSGPSSNAAHADTQVIAAHLKDIIQKFIDAASTATAQAVNDVSVTGGQFPGIEARNTNTVAPANAIWVNGDVAYKIEFTIDQPTTGATGAKGYILTNSSGNITDVVLTHQGSKYDSNVSPGTGHPLVYTIKIYKSTQTLISAGFYAGPTVGYVSNNQINRSPWVLFKTVTSSNATSLGYVFPAFTSIIPNVAGSSLKVDHKGSLIRVKTVNNVAHNGSFYTMLKEHTAVQADNEPGVGTDWREYWEEDTTITNAKAWLDGSRYILSDFRVNVADGLANQALGVIYKEVTSITDLPSSCFEGFKVKVIGDDELVQDDYYVQFKTKDNEEYGEGTWVETAGWYSDNASTSFPQGLPTVLDNNTMPIVLKPVFGDVSLGQDANKIYSFKAQTPLEDSEKLSVPPGWGGRQAGDDNTNPFPSFTGTTINDIFFFKNRLGFLTNDNIIFSEADEYFNFFRTTTQQLLDSAPIDVGISHTKVAQLQHALPFQEKLMLFSRQSQFVLRGGDLLTPKTVSISPVTEYDISDNIDPVALGNYIYFPFKRDAFEGMYEYFVDNNTEVFEANEITAQVPKLISSDITHLVGTAAENMIVAKSNTDDYTLFVYKYYWQNKEKIQSAWMKFTYNRKIRGFDFIDSDLMLLTEDSQGLHLEKATMENGLIDDGLSYRLYLDSRINGSELTVNYSSSSKTTTISDFDYDPVDVHIYTKGGTFKKFTRTSDTAGTVSGALGSYVDYGGEFVNHNGVTYYCLQDNAGIGVTEPGVGAEWTQYWKAVDFDSSRPAWIGTLAWQNVVSNWESLTSAWDAGESYTGGIVYKCIQDHTSTAATEPGVGADWATYWAVSTDFNTAALWLLGNDYHDDKYFFAGIPYNMLYRFSNQILKQPTERGGRSASDYTFQTIRNASIEYADTGHFTVEVTPRFRDTYTYPYNPALLASISTLNDFTPESGHFKFAVQAQPNEVTIEIKSDSALPCKLVAAEFESMVIPRSKRYGS
jgi:hypothetical protein